MITIIAILAASAGAAAAVKKHLQLSAFIARAENDALAFKARLFAEVAHMEFAASQLEAKTKEEFALIIARLKAL